MKIRSNTRFLTLWFSQTISNSGDTIFTLAVVWFILSSTNSILLVGLVVASSFVPEIVVAPFAGTLVDRFNRRSVLMTAYLLQAIIVGSAGILYLFGKLGFAYSLLTVICLAIGEQFTIPANSALLPSIVEREELISANGMLSSTNSLNMLGSNALGGLMIFFIGISAPFEYDALTFLIAIAFLAFLPRSAGSPVDKDLSNEYEQEGETMISQLVRGYSYLKKDRLLLKLTILSVVVSFFALGLQGIYAPYVKIELNGSAAIYGLFLASFGLGSIAGSIVIARVGNRIRTGNLIMIGLFGQAVTILSLGLTHLAMIAISLWAICGFAQVTNIIPYQSFLQARIPGPLFGRVSTLISSLIYTPAPALILLTSVVTARFSSSLILLLYGTAMLLSVLLSFGLFRDLRTLDIGSNESLSPA